VLRIPCTGQMPLTSPARSLKGKTAYWVAWSACTALTLGIIFVPKYLPMVDLPQHAGQIAIWLDWNDPRLHYQDVYRLAPLPPAFVSTALAFALAHFVSVELALKVVIATAILGLPFVMRLLVEEVGGNPWWVFLTFPVGFGFPFGFGLINFCLGVPVAVFLVLQAARYAVRPSGARAALLFVTALLLFAIHAIAFGFGILVASAVIVLRSPTLRRAIVGLAPLLVLAPLVFVWIVAAQQAEPAVRTSANFQLGWHRLPLLLTALTGDPTAAGAILAGLTLFASPFIGGARPAPQPWRWAMLVLTAALYFGAPHFIFGTAFIYQRFAVFCIPGLLLALDSRSDQHGTRRPILSSAIAPALALILLLGVGIRFGRFNSECYGLDQLLTQIPRGARLLYLPIDRLSANSPFPVFLHSGMWHQVRQGGVTDFSFARFHMNRFRYCDGAAPTLPPGFEWRPAVFDWERDWGEAFDYFLVRSREDSRRALFKGAVDRVELVGNHDAWWLFRRVSSVQPSEADSARTSLRRPCGK
jgi:hypothetical protein